MATDEEIWKLIMKFEGEEQAKMLAAAVALAEQRFAAFHSSLGAGAAATRAAAGRVADLRQEMAKLKSSLNDSSQLMMQVGYAADDLQYGFAGIANNIQPIIQNIKGLEKAAPIISMVAIAAYQLYEHWDQLQALMGTGIPQPAQTGLEGIEAALKKATKEMDELLKQTRLEWYELDKLAKLKEQVKGLKEQTKAEQAVQAAIDTPSEAEKATGEGFKRAVAENGASAFGDYRATLEGQKDAKGQVFNEGKGEMTSVEDAARDTFAAALKGNKGARDAIGKAMPGSKFAADIEANSPEAAARDKKIADDDDKDIESANAKRLRDKDRTAKAKSEEEKENEHYRKQDEEHANRLAEFEEKRRVAGRDDLEKRAAKDADLKDELMKDNMKGPDKERRKSSVIGAEGLASSIQSAVGGEDKRTQEITKRQDKQTEFLKKMAENATGGIAAFDAGGVLRFQ